MDASQFASMSLAEHHAAMLDELTKIKDDIAAVQASADAETADISAASTTDTTGTNMATTTTDGGTTNIFKDSGSGNGMSGLAGLAGLLPVLMNNNGGLGGNSTAAMLPALMAGGGFGNNNNHAAGAYGIGGFLLGSLMGGGRGGLFGNNGNGNGNWDNGSGANSPAGAANMTAQNTHNVATLSKLGDVECAVKESACMTQGVVSAGNALTNQNILQQTIALSDQLHDLGGGINGGLDNVNNNINAANLSNLASFANTNSNIAAANLSTQQGFCDTGNLIAAANLSTQQGFAASNMFNQQGFTAVGQAVNGSTLALLQGLTAVKDSGVAVGQANLNATGAVQDAVVATGNAQALANCNLGQLVMGQGYQTLTAIQNDGDKTRALITHQYEATLNRQLSDANNAIIELRNEGRLSERTRGIEINMTNNQNQLQAQSQAQQQFQTMNGTLMALIGEIQKNSQSIVNLGTMSGSAGQQQAANTRVN